LMEPEAEPELVEPVLAPELVVLELELVQELAQVQELAPVAQVLELELEELEPVELAVLEPVLAVEPDKQQLFSG
jgi:hypothetical protein